MRVIVDALEAQPPQTLSLDERKLRDLSGAFVAQRRIDARGLEPVKADLEYIAHLETTTDVARAMGSVKLGTVGVFDVGVGIDPQNARAYSVNLSQSGLGLPDRDYYLRDDPALAATREAYKRFLTDLLALAGFENAAARAADAYAVEARIAQVSRAPAHRPDHNNTHNPRSSSQL